MRMRSIANPGLVPDMCLRSKSRNKVRTKRGSLWVETNLGRTWVSWRKRIGLDIHKSMEHWLMAV